MLCALWRRKLARSRRSTASLRHHTRTAGRDDTIALHLYRIAQEAVNNAVKHSGAKNILISLEPEEDNLCLTVADDGKGLPKRKRHKGLGVHIMKYRANVLGGTLEIESGQRSDTIVSACIPRR